MERQTRHVCAKKMRRYEAKTDKTSKKKKKDPTDESTIILQDSNNPLSVMNRSSRQKISKDIVGLNSIINQLDMIDI